MHSLRAFARTEDPMAAGHEACLAALLDPVPVSEVPAVCHSLLLEMLSRPLLSVGACVLQDLQVPLVAVEHLRAFFSSEQVRYIGARRVGARHVEGVGGRGRGGGGGARCGAQAGCARGARGQLL